MGLLLVLYLCISTWTGKTLGDENGVVTVNVSQGKDAILPCSPTTKENLSFKSFKWRKDGQNVFYYDAGSHYNNGHDGQDPQFKDRVSFFQDQLGSGDASIQIQTVTIQDNGIYSCEISGLNSGSQTFNIKLLVNVPILQTREGSDVMLPCSPSGKDDLTHETFDWQKDDEQQVFLYRNGKHYNNGLTGQNENFRNRVEFFQDQLQFGNASIRIKNTKLTDSGNYSCTIPHLQPPGQKFYMKLVVHVCPKPRLGTKKTADGIRVICSVPDVSKVEMEMELHNSDDKSVGQLVDAGTSQNNKYFIFSVTKEGDYRCLVKQKEFCHQIYSEESFVLISGDDKGLSPGYVAVIVAFILSAILNITLLYFLWKCTRSSGRV
uniref:Ig-like domain-containing protein n=1 Tax=Poecilia formosa TaxID=48698 RepID=A0A096LV02_POEFO